MTDTITVTGVIGTEPRRIDTANGTAMTSFRLASAQRRFDRSAQKWIDGSTNWYTVTAFNQLAGNALASLTRGDRVIVSGRLSIRTWEAGEKAGTDVTVLADGIGADLAWGTSRFTKTVGRASSGDAEPGRSVEPEWAAHPPAGSTFEPATDGGADDHDGSEASLHSVATPF